MKKQLLSNAPEVFSDNIKKHREETVSIEDLLKQIGQLQSADHPFITSIEERTKGCRKIDRAYNES